MSRSVWLAALSLLALACNNGPDYAGLKFDVQSAPPVSVSVESDRIEIPVGIAVQVAVKPQSDHQDYSSKDQVTLRSDDDNTLGVYSGTDDRTFVFVGLREGTTCLQVKINRDEKECIDVRVLAGE